MSARSPEAPQFQMDFPTLESYQEFAMLDWLYDFGSDDAQLHLRAKFEEETKELTDALKENDREAIIGETGDVLWTAAGCSVNGGINLEESVRHELGAYIYDESPITTEKIDELALGLIPDEPLEVMTNWLEHLAMQLGKASKGWHRLGPLLDNSQPLEFGISDVLIDFKRLDTYDALTQTLLICSSLAQRKAGSSLEQVMQHNAQKLAGRKANGEPLTKPPRNQIRRA